MSRKRQTDSGLGNPPEPIARSFRVAYAAGADLPDHRHPGWHQLVGPDRGALTVRSGEEAWIAPPGRLVWIPAGSQHRLSATGGIRLAAVYLRADAVDRAPRGGGRSDRCAVLGRSSLLRALLERVLALGTLSGAVAAHRRLLAVLLDELEAEPAAPLVLPMPAEPRAARLAARVLAAPGDPRDLAALAPGCGASQRTLERLFVAETGWTFGRWRLQARLLCALERLAAGQPVTSVALEVGYRSPSAFIAAFRRHLGETPGSYLRR